MCVLFDILAKANLHVTVNIVESDFCHAYEKYLGYKVGPGHVTPIMAKEEAFANFLFLFLLQTRRNQWDFRALQDLIENFVLTYPP